MLLFRAVAGAQVTPVPWAVPDEARQKVCPFQFTPETVKSGEGIFLRNCKSCHGDPGKQNWAKICRALVWSCRIPETNRRGDVLPDHYRENPDATVRKILTTEERWQVISFIRSFNPAYVQPLPVVNVQREKNLKLYLYCNYRQKQLYVCCPEITRKNREPDPGN